VFSVSSNKYDNKINIKEILTMNLNSINNTNNNNNNNNNNGIGLTELHFDNIPVMNDTKPWATIILATVFFFIGIVIIL